MLVTCSLFHAEGEHLSDATPSPCTANRPRTAFMSINQHFTNYYVENIDICSLWMLLLLNDTF